MYNKSNHFKNLPLLMLLLPLIACADSPKSPVSGSINDTRLVEPVTGEVITAMALKYEGRDTMGRTCNLYLSLHEEHEKSGDAHLLMKVDYTTLDGHKPHAGEADFYQYDSSTGTYYSEDSNQANTQPSLLSIALKDADQGVDANDINEYIQNSELEQYMKIDFSADMKTDAFKESLEKVLEETAEINDELDVFDSVELTTLALLHNDHYHFPTCINLEPTTIEEVEFELEEEDHDGHDHDHDHDHIAL